MEVPACVLPNADVAQCNEIEVSKRDEGQVIRLVMSAVQITSVCPKCMQASPRIHSRYRRKLWDLPWAGVPVVIELSVRRFFCDNPACQAHIFTERIPTLVQPWARKTARLQALQQQLGWRLGGSSGSAMCQALGCPASHDVVIGLVRSTALPPAPTPRVLGVDDWAKRKGQTYGTILVDHERQCVVDVLKDRTPETLAEHRLRPTS